MLTRPRALLLYWIRFIAATLYTVTLLQIASHLWYLPTEGYRRSEWHFNKDSEVKNLTSAMIRTRDLSNESSNVCHEGGFSRSTCTRRSRRRSRRRGRRCRKRSRIIRLRTFSPFQNVIHFSVLSKLDYFSILCSNDQVGFYPLNAIYFSVQG